MESYTTQNILQQNMLNGTLQQQSVNTTAIQNIILNDTADGNNYIMSDHQISNIAALVICVPGIPLNCLVIAVYFRRMTTSIRMYMFALAVVDLVVCIWVIVLATTRANYVLFSFANFFVSMTALYSIFLLAFVSVERLMAVRHPYKFSLSVQRAKWALVTIAFAAGVSSLILSVSQLLHYRRFVKAFQSIAIISSVGVMIVCYTLMAITIVMKERAAHSSIGVASSATAQGPSTVSRRNNEVLEMDETDNQTSRKTESGGKNTTSTGANTVKNVSLVFVITVVFLLCWTPFLLTNVAPDLPVYVRRTFYFNSVVNPFIYSIMSRMFRTDVQHFYRDVCSSLSQC